MKNFVSKLGVGAIVVVVILLLVSLTFIGSFFTIIDAGTVGVVSTFGKVNETVLDPGFHLKNPFANIIHMNVRTSSYTMSGTYSEGEVSGDDSIQALASDGGLVWFDVTVLYKLKSDKASVVYKELGLSYEENIVRPAIRSTIRSVAANYPVNELYSTKRSEVQSKIYETLITNIEKRGIQVEEVLLRKVNISEQLSDSIEQKLAAEQEVQRLTFEIQKAEKEAERKKVEAEGQKEAQRIINESLTDKYLYYMYISNLQNLEGTIYVPVNPENGLPMFKGVN